MSSASATVMTQVAEIAKASVPSPSTSVLPLAIEQPVAGPSVIAVVRAVCPAAVFSAMALVWPLSIVKTNWTCFSSPSSAALTLPLSLVIALASMTIATAAARPIATLLRSFVVNFLSLFVFASLCGMAATMTVVRACKHLEGCGRYPLG